MKPTREGYWWYKGEVVKIERVMKRLYVLTFDIDDDIFVDDTKDSDWGPEILPPCKDRCQVCCNDNRPCYGECRHEEITRPIPDDIPVNG